MGEIITAECVSCGSCHESEKLKYCPMCGEGLFCEECAKQEEDAKDEERLEALYKEAVGLLVAPDKIKIDALQSRLNVDRSTLIWIIEKMQKNGLIGDPGQDGCCPVFTQPEPCPPGIRMVPWYETYCQICGDHTDEEWPTAWPTIQGAIEHRDAGAVRTEKGEYICDGCVQGDAEDE